MRIASLLLMSFVLLAALSTTASAEGSFFDHLLERIFNSIDNALFGNAVTGLATKAIVTAELDLYDHMNNDALVGTAQQESEGRKQSITAGNELLIKLTSIKSDNAPVEKADVTIEIRKGSDVVKEITGSASNGEFSNIYKVPSDWDGNYHVRAYILHGSNVATEEAEFKVEAKGENDKEDDEEDDKDDKKNESEDEKDDDDEDEEDDGNSRNESEDEKDDDDEDDKDDEEDDDEDGKKKCKEGSNETCQTEKAGNCVYGLKVCANGIWGPCVGITVPKSEECNNKDDDCDGEIDEEVSQNCGSRNVGACAYGTKTCTKGSWGECTGAIEPDIEACNGADDDCDGHTDEELTQSCGKNIGTCTTGTQTCVNGQWGSCSGTYKGPTTEQCNGVDDDCNGAIDDGVTCECTNGAERECGSNIGACNAGKQTCTEGKWGACENEVKPLNETCNNADDDCDGIIDEEIVRSCGNSFIGTCSYGIETCNAGEWGSCTGAITPKQEACNSIDDDCDGEADESLVEICGTSNVGACAYGTKTCSAGNWSSCTANIEPSAEFCNDGIDNNCNGEIDEACKCTPEDKDNDGYNSTSCDGNDCDNSNANANPGAFETCDGIDNDCDGEIDESLVEACGSDIGTCSKGTRTCSAGAWGTCTGAVAPAAELCNGVDDNCNGVVDEKITQSCGSNIGECSSGTQTCLNGAWTGCSGNYLGPSSEICNGKDDNCDGQIDNGISCGECTDGATEQCGSNIGACAYGARTCSAGVWGSCAGGITPRAESCDNTDNDCDGTIDDIKKNCGTTDIGACEYGVQTCSSGAWGGCTGNVEPNSETCDGIDNDCDGFVDESLSETCGVSEVGACRLGVKVCSSGNWTSCVGNIDPASETCDGLDNNCDGATDEGCPPALPQQNVTNETVPAPQPEQNISNETIIAVQPSPAPIISGGGSGGTSSPAKRSSSSVTSVGVKPLVSYTEIKTPSPLLLASTCYKGDGCVQGCVPSDPDCAKTELDLVLVDAPNTVDITDNTIYIGGYVENKGNTVLNEVYAVPELMTGWSGEEIYIGKLSPGERKSVIFTVKSQICSFDSRPGTIKFSKDELDELAMAFHGREGATVLDTERLDLQLRVPLFSVMTAPNDYSVSSTMRTCFILNNFDRKQRNKLEIEFELSDQKHDLIIDLFGTAIGADEAAIKVKDYRLQQIPRTKEYTLRANLFENGTVFTKGYRAGEASATIDLSNAKEHLTGVNKFFKRIKKLIWGD